MNFMSSPRAIGWSSGVLVLAALGVGSWWHSKRERHLIALRQEVARLEREVARVHAQQPASPAERTAIDSIPTSAENATADATPFSGPAGASVREVWLQRTRQLKRLFEERPEAAIPELRILGDRDWLRLAATAQFESEDLIRRTLANARYAAKNIFAAQLDAALRRYTRENGGQLPSNIHLISAHFEAPPDPEMLARFQMTGQGSVAERPTDAVIEERSLIDSDYDTFFSVAAAGGVKRASGPGVEFNGSTDRARRAYRQANGRPGDWRDLTAYFSPPLDTVQHQRYLQFVQQMEMSRKPRKDAVPKAK